MGERPPDPWTGHGSRLNHLPPKPWPKKGGADSPGTGSWRQGLEPACFNIAWKAYPGPWMYRVEMSVREDKPKRIATVTLLAVFTLLNLRVATYHLATEGWKSGLAETALTLWVMLLVYLATEASRRREDSPSWRRAQLAARGMGGGHRAFLPGPERLPLHPPGDALGDPRAPRLPGPGIPLPGPRLTPPLNYAEGPHASRARSPESMERVALGFTVLFNREKSSLHISICDLGKSKENT